MPELSRRRFLAGASAAAAAGFFSSVAPQRVSAAPSERLNIAAIGTSNRAAADIRGVATQNIVALADIDGDLLEKSAELYPQAKKYRDFRELLDKEAARLDAVVVGTPDHTHAPAAALALRLKKHVYCEKPLTHTVFEARRLAELAAEHKLVTQMGTQIHAGDNYRRVVELVQAGAIGEVREAHVWVGVDYSGAKLTTNTSAPAHVDWNLWLGPAPERPYTEGAHPHNWRWFWEWGTGGLGDFGCHYIDLVHWALDLTHPTRVEAKGPTPDPIATTSGLEVTWQYPARGKRPPVTLKWYDGGVRPTRLAELKDGGGKSLDWKSGQLFVGSEGMIVSDYNRHLLLPADKFADYRRPEQTIPTSIGHHEEWIAAIKEGGETTCNFAYSGALTESVLLGVAAYRSGAAMEWDAKNLKVTNSRRAQQFIHTEYRQGWEL